jgi:hypothetical protein
MFRCKSAVRIGITSTDDLSSDIRIVPLDITTRFGDWEIDFTVKPLLNSGEIGLEFEQPALIATITTRIKAVDSKLVIDLIIPVLLFG